MLDRVKPQTLQNAAFRDDVIEGLSRPQKTLPSRWLYDDIGSALFEDITQLAEYYPTRTETAILRRFAGDIAAFTGPNAVVIEYGAGAGVKTKLVLDALDSPAAYVPVDIAGDFLAMTVHRMNMTFPAMRTWPVVADFTTEFRLPSGLPAGRRMAFFPGSTLGNLDTTQAELFLRRMRHHVGLQGRAVIGIDLLKDVDTLRAAYDDAQGVTAAFNRNLLSRINRELEGDFRVEGFKHVARWNAAERAIEMHLVSLGACSVTVDGQRFRFAPGETIHTESSRKYDLAGIAALVEMAGWTLEHTWTDADAAFAVVGLGTVG
ncbi:MAG: egtD [Rhodoferax sp.]|nr:egtD [Rhodoferax sp.]